MELYRTSGSVNSLPLQDDAELVEKYFDWYGNSEYMEGVEAAYNKAKTASMVEGVKVVPGYNAARYNAQTVIQVGETPDATMFDLLNACVVGGLDISQYVTGPNNINDLANSKYQQWMALNGKYYD